MPVGYRLKTVEQNERHPLGPSSSGPIDDSFINGRFGWELFSWWFVTLFGLTDVVGQRRDRTAIGVCKTCLQLYFV